MKKLLLFVLCFAGLGSVAAQAPQITGDLMLCPWTNGTATVTNQPFDTYQWYSKFWFTSDEYVPIQGATGPSFTYDWYTYDQSLFKVVATLNGTEYESNVIQIDSYAWVSLTVGTELNDNVSINNENGNLMLCTGASFTASIFMPYNAHIQWYKDGDPIPGANQMTYQITGPGSYHVEAAPDFCPESSSNNAGLPIVVEDNPSCALGINNPANASSIVVYPNPVSDVLGFDLKPDAQFTGYSIIDVSGKIVSQNELVSGQPHVQLNVGHLSGGFYLLKLNGGNTTVVKRFVKK